MKQIIWILILVLGLEACNDTSTENKVDKSSIGASEAISTGKPKSRIYIKDKSQYDPSFIRGLADFNEPIQLIDKYIVYGIDTVYFPEDLALNSRTTFTASKDSNNYSLTLKRTNLTNIDFEFQLIDKYDSVIESKSGLVVLKSGFFLAPEGELDVETGDSFFGQNYDIKNDSIGFTIKVGLDKDYAGKKRAKITYESKAKSAVIESPILRLK